MFELFLNKKTEIRKIKIKPILFIIFYFILNIYFSKIPQLALVEIMKILELPLLYYFLKSHNWLLSDKLFILPLSVSLLYSTIIGLAQVISGQTIGGAFYFLGERTFNITTPAIAKFRLDDNWFLRAYSTFPHPNVFAGFAATIILIVIPRGAKTASLYKSAMVFVTAVVLLITQSLGAIIFLFLSLSVAKLISKPSISKIKLLPQLIITIIFLLSITSSLLSDNVNLKNFQAISIKDRFYLLSLSNKVIRSRDFNPIFGVGANNYLPVISKQIPHISNYIDLQPVHNVYTLIFVEYGAIGLSLMLIILFKALKLSISENNKLRRLSLILFIAFSALVDHYWLTSHQTRLLLPICLALLMSGGKLIKYKTK